MRGTPVTNVSEVLLSRYKGEDMNPHSFETTQLHESVVTSPTTARVLHPHILAWKLTKIYDAMASDGELVAGPAKVSGGVDLTCQHFGRLIGVVIERKVRCNGNTVSTPAMHVLGLIAISRGSTNMQRL